MKKRSAPGIGVVSSSGIPNPCWSRYSVGYAFENWWYLAEAGDSRGELTTQGVFFRAEFAY